MLWGLSIRHGSKNEQVHRPPGPHHNETATALGFPGLVLRLSETECAVLLLKWYASDESSMQADFGFGYDY